MTSAERKVRLNVAREILSGVQTDICNEYPLRVSKADTEELTDIIIRLTYLTSRIENVPDEEV